VHQLEIKVLDIVDARCKHEVYMNYCLGINQLLEHWSRTNMMHYFSFLIFQ